MRRCAALLLALFSTAALAATDPRTVPTQLPPAWQAKTRELFKQTIEIPSVHNRGEVPRVAKVLADQFRAAGIPDSDIAAGLAFASVGKLYPRIEFPGHDSIFHTPIIRQPANRCQISGAVLRAASSFNASFTRRAR